MPLPRIINRNWALKVSCLVLAVLLWFLIVGEPEVVTVEAVPLTYGNLSPDLVLLSDPPDAVRLELRGPSREIARENLAGLKVLLDFSAVQGAGDRTFEIEESQLHLPAGVAFLRAVPGQVKLSFDRVETRDVPVDVRWKGKTADGYHVAGKKVTPTQVRISGPASRVNAVNASVAEVDLSDQSKGFAANVAALTSAAGVRLEPPSVRVEVAIEKGTHLQE